MKVLVCTVWPGIVLMSFLYTSLEVEGYSSSVQLFGWDNGVTGKSDLQVYVRAPHISGCRATCRGTHCPPRKCHWHAHCLHIEFILTSVHRRFSCTGGVVSMRGFLEQFFPDIIGKSSTQSGDLYCTFNDDKIQWFTSSLFLAGAATELSGTTGVQCNVSTAAVRENKAESVHDMLLHSCHATSHPPIDRCP